MPDFRQRSHDAELMDDFARPEQEFADAYRELAAINRRLGGIHAIEKFLPAEGGLSILDVAAGGCDVGEALSNGKASRIVSLDLNVRGLHRARHTIPLVADALKLPFRNGAFDVVMASLFFHHLNSDQCVNALKEMLRTARNRVIVNDLHRHPVAYASIRLLALVFSKSVMVKNDGPLSVLRAFRPDELLEIARRANVPARVYRSFPYRIVLVAEKGVGNERQET